MGKAVCESCKEAPPRYKCPGCEISTCSLQCSKSHKSISGCTGKRDLVAFIPRSKFNDATINNDYNFLTALERNLDNAARKGSENLGGRHLNQVRAFVKRAKDVGEVTVHMAPQGLQRSKMNTSAWIPKKNQLSWTVEWLFDGVERRVSQRVLQSTTLRDAIEHIVQKLPEQLTHHGVTTDKLHFLLKDEGSRTLLNTYARFDGRVTLGEALRHRSVIEFPTIHCYTELPEHIKLEREYVFAHPQSVKLPATGDIMLPTGSDFIPLGAGDESPEGSAERLSNKAEVVLGLPILNLDELEVPT